jgi:hypothetical protein
MPGARGPAKSELKVTEVLGATIADRIEAGVYRSFEVEFNLFCDGWDRGFPFRRLL